MSTLKVVDGWPCILESLRWTERCPLYLMGQYTALQVGKSFFVCLFYYANIGFRKKQKFCYRVHEYSVFYFPKQVGPHAVNLAGGQAASMRIAKDIMHRQMQDEGQNSVTRRGKLRTEEYIQQMQGIFWL